MNYPRVVIYLDRLKENANTILSWAKNSNVDICYVNKCVCGDPLIAKELLPLGFSYLGDSRISNLEKVDVNIPKLLLRIGSIANAEEIILNSDISLQSDVDVIKALNESSKKHNLIHNVILMIDLGDLREGIFFKNEQLILDIASKILTYENIKLKGIGVNLTCYGSIMPTEENLTNLVNIKKMIEDKFNIKLDIVSGGNSSSLYLLKNKKLPSGISMLRVGEAILLGTDTSIGSKFEDLRDDAFILECEIVELYNKPSYPIGTISVDAFGQKQEYVDLGNMNRAILAIGKQDVDISMITPIDDVDIIGGSSDHLIVNIKNNKFKVGDVIRFKLQYGSLLRVFTSSYVKKVYKN